MLALGAQNTNIALLALMAVVVAASADVPVLVLLLFWRRLNTVGVIAGVTAGLVLFGLRASVVDSIGRCLISAVDPDRPGPRGAPSRSSRSTNSRPDNANDDLATAAPSTPPPAPPPRQSMAMPAGDGGWVQTVPRDLDALLAEPAADPAFRDAAAVNPALLAQRAIEQLVLDQTPPHSSAGAAGVVGVPIWLWVGAGAGQVGPVTATAAAGAARVTAEARLVAVEWSMGPPGELVRCSGPGTPWTGQDGRSPDCGYTYRLRSLPERTAGTGEWQIFATAVWSVTWSGFTDGAPVSGGQTLRVPAGTTLAVGEVQVLVDGDGT